MLNSLVTIRRTITIVFWPSTDLIVTIFANFMLVRYKAWIAVPATIVMTMLLNFLLLYLLSFEEEAPHWVETHFRKVKFIHSAVGKLTSGEALAILAVYTISGPAMAGAPLIWLLDIRGRKAFFLVVAGVTLNALLWVGGVYNIFWALMHDVVRESRNLF